MINDRIMDDFRRKAKTQVELKNMPVEKRTRNNQSTVGGKLYLTEIDYKAMNEDYKRESLKIIIDA